VGLDVVAANIQVVMNGEGITEEVAHVPVATLKWASMGGCFAAIWRGFWGMFYTSS
jgi:spore maturation protein SpmB